MAEQLTILDNVRKYFFPLGKRETKKFYRENPGFVGPIAGVKPWAMTKEEQLETILKTNPMRDDYHKGTRTIDDVHTLPEVIRIAREEHPEYKLNSYPDLEDDVYDEALKSGYIDVYSSKPIVNGNFVAVSPMMAQDYGGMNRPPNYHERLPITDISWIDTDEGQVARRRDTVTPHDLNRSKWAEDKAYRDYKNCGKEFGSLDKKCLDLLDRWYDLRQSNYNVNYHVKHPGDYR